MAVHGHVEPPQFVAHQHHNHPPHVHMGTGMRGARPATPTGQPPHGAIAPAPHMTGPVAPPWALKGLASSPYAAFASRNDPAAMAAAMPPPSPGPQAPQGPGPNDPEMIPPWAQQQQPQGGM